MVFLRTVLPLREISDEFRYAISSFSLSNSIRTQRHGRVPAAMGRPPASIGFLRGSSSSRRGKKISGCAPHTLTRFSLGLTCRPPMNKDKEKYGKNGKSSPPCPEPTSFEGFFLPCARDAFLPRVYMEFQAGRLARAIGYRSARPGFCSLS